MNEIDEEGNNFHNIEKIITDVSPEIANDNPQENQEDESTHTYVENEECELFQIDKIKKVVNLDWPEAETKPINEFEFDGLCSMTFPCLFPYGLGDPTKKARLFEVSETDGYKHLLKYAYVSPRTKNYIYPFAKHPRFKFWAYDRLRRHRALSQSKVILMKK